MLHQRFLRLLIFVLLGASLASARDLALVSNKANPTSAIDPAALLQLAWPSVAGMALSFLAGLVALRWLSRWLEHGRWHFFGFYCLAAAALARRLTAQLAREAGA